MQQSWRPPTRLTGGRVKKLIGQGLDTIHGDFIAVSTGRSQHVIFRRRCVARAFSIPWSMSFGTGRNFLLALRSGDLDLVGMMIRENEL